MFGSNMEFETTMAVESVVHTSQRAHGVGTPSRHEKSLGLLTVKFVSLLQEAEDGVLDLKVVSRLNSTQHCAALIYCHVFAASLQSSVNKGLALSVKHVHRFNSSSR